MNETMNTALKEFYLTCYRYLGLGGLAALALLLVYYVATFLFFGASNTWVAPTLITSADEKAITSQLGMIQLNQQRDTIVIQKLTAESQLQSLRNQKSRAETLLARFNHASTFESKQATNLASQMGTLVGGKQDRDSQAETLNASLLAYEGQIKKQLDAGIITQEDANRQLTANKLFALNIDSSKLAAETIIAAKADLENHAATLNGKDMHLTTLESTARLQELETALETATISIVTTQETLKAETSLLVDVDASIQNLRNTPYIDVLNPTYNGKMPIAFVPYDNKNNVKIGDPIYSCFFQFFACWKVGSVVKIYPQEQIVDYPVFNLRFARQIRGFMVQVNFTRPSAISSQVLFVGGKPVLL